MPSSPVNWLRSKKRENKRTPTSWRVMPPQKTILSWIQVSRRRMTRFPFLHILLRILRLS
jgi:hypothetical protein